MNGAPAAAQFAGFVAVSFVAFVAILLLALNRRRSRAPIGTILQVGALVVVGGMIFAKAATAAGLPVWAYFGIPALATWIVPPVIFRMTRSEVAIYLILALAATPAIHVVFTLLLGWDQYLPFLPIAD